MQIDNIFVLLMYMKESDRTNKIIRILKEEYPKSKTALDFTSPLEILIATILSAQCTDRRVNIVTKDLFAKYKSASDYMYADMGELESIIRPTGFFRNKAKSIVGAATMLVKEFGGKVPDNMEDMLRLPGVARKTANVVISEAYGVIEGIAVDTHVMRLSGRLRLSTRKTPEKIEQDLMAIYPKNEWYNVCNLLITHGRSVCDARKPKCCECILAELCPGKQIF